MKTAILLAGLLLASRSFAQWDEQAKGFAITNVCGRLAKQLPNGQRADSPKAKWLNLRGIRIRLYKRSVGTPCCSAENLIGEQVTGKKGAFTFGETESGLYWLVAPLDGKEYTVPIRFEQTEHPNACSIQMFGIDTSDTLKFWFRVRVEVYG